MCEVSEMFLETRDDKIFPFQHLHYLPHTVKLRSTRTKAVCTSNWHSIQTLQKFKKRN